MPRFTVAFINLENLRFNYRLLKERARSAEIMAVVKAEAYGHGVYPIAQTLIEEGCRGFAVTDANEGAELRYILDRDSDDPEITLLSGISDLEDANITAQGHVHLQRMRSLR